MDQAILQSFARNLWYDETPGAIRWELGLDDQDLEEGTCPNYGIIDLHTSLWSRNEDGNDSLVAYYGGEDIDNYIENEWEGFKIVASMDGMGSCCTL